MEVRSEVIQRVAGDIEDGDDTPQDIVHRDDELATRGRAAGDMPRESLDVRDDERPILGPRRAADPTATTYARAGDVALERA